MKDFIKKIIRKRSASDSMAEDAKAKNVSDTTNAVFEQYKKSFKDLARYDREGKVGAN
ncbi:hypothetical protein HZA26_03235 [Candidatus Nomurabacteria bacterium]|nr:hypothetical protein [Candidatus Nomurabacteria bacterium]